jgi:hypothetical protein
MGRDYGYGQEYLMRLNMGVQVNSDGNRVETMVETTMDMGAIMGAMMGGMEVQMGIFTATEGGEIAETRIYMGGTEVSEMFGGLDFSSLGAFGGIAGDNLIASMFDFIPQISAAELENFDIRYDRFNGTWRIWFLGIQAPLGFDLFNETMQAFDIDTNTLADVLLSFDAYENNPPHIVRVETYWQDNAFTEYFMSFRVDIL